MEYFWILILVIFFTTNSLDKAESVQLFDEIFGEGWWDNDKAEEWNKLTLEKNVHHQIDRQNTQLGQIEPNSTDQLGPIEPNSTDQLGQIEPNSSDQNPPLTESDHSDNANLSEKIAEDEQKRKIVAKFNEIKDEFKQKGKYSANKWVQIEIRIAKHLKVNRTKLYKWKKEFGLCRKIFYEKEERKHLIEKFDQMKAELLRDGFKNFYHQEIDKTVVKKLGLSFTTIYKWKRELGQTKPNIHFKSKRKELMKRYYEIKDQTPKIRDEDIAKMLKIGRRTLCSWKKQFKQQKFHQNSVDGHLVEENAAANVQEIGTSNSGIFE